MASSQGSNSPSYVPRATSSSDHVLWRWVGSSKSNFLNMSASEVLIWASLPYPGKLSGVVSFGEDPLSLGPAWCMYDPQEGKKQWRTRTMFLLLHKLAAMVSTQRYLFKRNRFSADKEMNEGCFKREKWDFTVLKLISMLRSNLRES